jgi:hypothetical protein
MEGKRKEGRRKRKKMSAFKGEQLFMPVLYIIKDHFTGFNLLSFLSISISQFCFFSKTF